jgi:hypothetical protein
MSDNTLMAEWPLNKREHLRVPLNKRAPSGVD